MLKILFALWLFATSLLAALPAEIADFDDNFTISPKSVQKEMFAELKNLYVKAIIYDQSELKKQVLPRLIMAAKALKMDYEWYEKDLAKLTGAPLKKSTSDKASPQAPAKSAPAQSPPKQPQTTPSQTKPASKPQPSSAPNVSKTPSKAKEPAKTQSAKDSKTNVAKEAKKENAKQASNQQKTAKTEKKEALNTKEQAPASTDTKEIKASPSATQEPKKPQLYLMSATKKDKLLELKFNLPLDDVQTKTLFLNTPPNYRNVLDIQAHLNGKPLSFTNFLSDEIRIAQFDKEFVRIVFKNHKQQSVTAEIKGDKMLIKAEDFIVVESEQKAKKPNSKATKEQKQDSPKDKAKQTQKPIIKSAPSTEPILIVIDPGHGGKDPGALSLDRKLNEKTAVLAVAKKLGARLKKLGYRVKYTRDKDEFINLRDRTKFANEAEADLFVSIHANAAPNAKAAKNLQGIETFFLSPARSERSKNAAAIENQSDIDEMNFFSQQTFLNFLNREKIIASNKLGIDIQKQVLKRVRTRAKVNDGGVREAPFWVLVGALMPAVLVEIGYITHPVEGKLLFDKKYQDELARGICEGIEQYFKKNR